ncbi:PhzF family phenazine biosynthesis protein [Georgenia sp. MJ206]|uniref:PhzF family phenazine biosynthesis protein n=1 Tax=Georgenia wangjunii TaxID=3117730 RepID=UPI002F262E48
MTRRTAFALVDAFTTARAFSGNPAGVVLLDELSDDAWMQGIANELAQAETAFLSPGDRATFHLRWFTPVAEVALCGHATLAAAHRLWETGVLPAHATAVFETLSGRLTARREGDRIVLDFPALPASPVPPDHGLLAALAGPVPVWTGVTDAADPGERNILAVLASEDTVRELTPDLRAVAALPAGGLIVTAKRNDAGVVSRYFAPAYGIPEDPVTGSAHCTVGPYWRDQLGATLAAEQASPRGGELTVVTTDTGRVLLGGRARTAGSGFLL